MATQTSAARVTFDPACKAARAIVATATDGAFAALNVDVVIARMFMEAVRAKQMLPKHVKQIMQHVSIAIAKRWRDKGIKREVKPFAASRASELASAGKLADYACADNVFRTLATLDVGMDSIYAVSKAVREKGDKASKTGPARDAMVRIINARRSKKNGKGTSRKGKKRRNIDLVKRTASLQADVSALIQNVGKLEGHEHLSRIAKELATFASAAKRIMKARADAAAEAAAA